MKFPALRNRNKKSLNNWLALTGLFLLVAFHLTGSIPFQDQLRTFAFDLYQYNSPRERISSPVVIIEIDEASLNKYGQWPWPRGLLGQIVEKINTHNPAAVAIDIIMPEPDRSSPCEATSYIPGINPELVKNICKLPSNDELLASQIAKGKVVLGIAGLDNRENTSLKAAPIRILGEDPYPFVRNYQSAITNISTLEQAALGQAILSIDTERGVVRRVPLIASVSNTMLPSLSLEILRLAVNSPFYNVTADKSGIRSVGVHDLEIPTRPDGSIWVHYSSHDPSRFISVTDLLEDKVDSSHLESKLVLIGFTGVGLIDFPSTVLGERVPGVEIHAQVLESIFDGTILKRPDWALWLEAALILVLGITVIYVFPMVKAWLQVPSLISLVLLICYAGTKAFTDHLLLLDAASPSFVFMALYSAMVADSLIREEAQIEELEHDLRKKREEAAKIQGEMEAAKRFQMGILPSAKEISSKENRIDIAAMMEPAKMVGGDLYDCFMLDENHIFFSLGDVCGKGVPASLFMVISKTLCKSIVLREEADYADLGTLITQANIEICRDNPETLFVTLFSGIIDLRNGLLTFCNAGHERPILFSPEATTDQLLDASGPPLGIIEHHVYKTYNYQMTPEQFLCIFSDGLTESNDEKQNLYGYQKLLATASEVNNQWDSEKLLNTLVNDVHSHAGQTEASDDLTIMVVRWQEDNN
ncbi:MAG: CHASE2 domain-containing protein [Neptuniibacter sp.]